MVTPAFVSLPLNRTMIPAVSYPLAIKISAPSKEQGLS